MQNMTGLRSFIASFNGVKGYRAKLNSSGGIDLADATNGTTIGILDADCQSGMPATVRLTSAPGTFEAIVNGAVTAGANLYPAADGSLAPASVSSNTATFRALEAATAAGDIIEVVRCAPNF